MNTRVGVSTESPMDADARCAAPALLFLRRAILQTFLDGGRRRRGRVQEPVRSGMPVRLAVAGSHPFCRALISLNLASARSNLSLKSHIASRISRKIADVLALSACPKAKMLLFRRYPMIRGSEIL